MTMGEDYTKLKEKYDKLADEYIALCHEIGEDKRNHKAKHLMKLFKNGAVSDEQNIEEILRQT